ncbi:BTB/POZ domain [Nesidiocoris tenuis]|uniref:BTB/POZ domain n=1 Tax=Nesidiocoris tenuis TaxID=355587 RepID=A0ABN7A662_9HEMI|nr:BTB/POZ domain [Nesidiocoris tenuis]
MGSAWSAVASYCPDSLSLKVSSAYSRKRKRDSSEDEEMKLNAFLSSPKKKKLTCTAMYIYQALFVEGKDSDITVSVLNSEWKLHKVYLGQSQYFHSMFSGSWNETKKNYITIRTEDERITVDALNTVFGSFYLDEITVEPKVVVGVLAASTMFQLEGLIEQCCEIMLETISPLTAVNYYEAACQYGAQNVKEKIISWFTINLTDYFAKNAVRLQDIEYDLMLTILKSPDLIVMQTEMSLYYLLRKWLYLRIFRPENEAMDSKDYKKLLELSDNGCCFLSSEKGEKYVAVFKQLKINHLLLHPQDNDAVVQDRIIPEEWLAKAYKTHWITLLRLSTVADKGPDRLAPEIFREHAIRCGRVLAEGDSRSWRWNWFNFGIDLIWSISDNGIFVKRHCSMCFGRRNTAPQHHILTEIEVINLDEQRQVKRSLKTDVVSFSLAKNQEVKLLTLTEDFDYPLYISIRVLITSPPLESKELEV